MAAQGTTYVPDFGDTIERIRSEQKALAERLEDTKQEMRATRLFYQTKVDSSGNPLSNYLA